MIHFFDLIILGSFWFWILLAALLVEVTILCEQNHGLAAFVSIAAFTMLLQLFGNFDILGYIWQNPLYIFGYAILYYLIGISYSIFKWKLFCNNKRDKYNAIKNKFLKSNNISGTAIPQHLIKEWNWELHCEVNSDDLNEYKNGIQFHNYIEQCITWALYWPCSLLWTLLDDPLRKLFTYTINQIKNIYDSIAARTMTDIKQDFQENNPST